MVSKPREVDEESTLAETGEAENPAAPTVSTDAESTTVLQPLSVVRVAAQASLEAELPLLLSELRAVVANLRADNRRLRKQLDQRDAEVVSLDVERGKRR